MPQIGESAAEQRRSADLQRALKGLMSAHNRVADLLRGYRQERIFGADGYVWDVLAKPGGRRNPVLKPWESRITADNDTGTGATTATLTVNPRSKLMADTSYDSAVAVTFADKILTINQLLWLRVEFSSGGIPTATLESGDPWAVYPAAFERLSGGAQTWWQLLASFETPLAGETPDITFTGGDRVLVNHTTTHLITKIACVDDLDTWTCAPWSGGRP